jgi:hypothetical protein
MNEINKRGIKSVNLELENVGHLYCRQTAGCDGGIGIPQTNKRPFCQLTILTGGRSTTTSLRLSRIKCKKSLLQFFTPIYIAGTRSETTVGVAIAWLYSIAFLTR